MENFPSFLYVLYAFLAPPTLHDIVTNFWKKLTPHLCASPLHIVRRSFGRLTFAPTLYQAYFSSISEEEKQVGDTWLLEKSTSRTLDKLAFNVESSSGLKSETPGRKN